MDRPPKKRKSSRRFWNLLAGPLIIVAFLGILFLGVDQLCVNDANTRLPYYPNSTRVSTTYNGLRIRGIGNGLELRNTSDDLALVEDWYREKTIELLNSNSTRGVNNLSNWFEDNAEGEGLDLFYLSQCVL